MRLPLRVCHHPSEKRQNLFIIFQDNIICCATFNLLYIERLRQLQHLSIDEQCRENLTVMPGKEVQPQSNRTDYIELFVFYLSNEIKYIKENLSANIWIGSLC